MLLSGRTVTSKQFLWHIQMLTVSVLPSWCPSVPWAGAAGPLERARCSPVNRLLCGTSWVPSRLELQLQADH